MRWRWWLCAGFLASQVSARLQPRNYEKNDYFALHLHPSTDTADVARQLGLHFEGPLGELQDHYTFSCPKQNGHDVEERLEDLRRRRKERRQLQRRGLPVAVDFSGVGGVLWSERQRLKQRLVKRIPPPPPELRQSTDDNQGAPTVEEGAQPEALKKLDEIATSLDIRDPIFKEQWHLFNPIQLGHDLNVTGVWLDGITGNGTISAVIDDGLDMYSDDLKDNYFAFGSWDFNDGTDEPRPRLSDDKHGTRCAGEIAAVKNNVCGVGMAYDSQVAGIRILSKPISDEDEAVALNYKYQDNQIYSCSWGPPDDGKTMDAPGILIRRAMVNGIQNGRQGYGSVFVFAAGNGAASEDNCNFDGYTNSIYSITVGGIDRAGNHPYYSELCSANLVVTYSSGEGDAIHTTDVGLDKCYAGHGGTSAAGPLVVGAVALALSARPDLSWRDLQYLVVYTAVPIHLDDGDWQYTAIGKRFSHTFGYGKMDTWAFVEAAKTFQSVKPQAWFHSPWLSVAHPIPQGDRGLASSFDVTAEMLKLANLERLEHVTVTMNVKHARRGDLSLELRSPEGVVSHLATSRQKDDANAGYDDWTFMSVVHWGESGVGTWTVIVKDTFVNEFNGTFMDWRLNLWGECIDPAIQDLLPLPDEHDDDHETASVPVHTTSIDPGPPPTQLPTNPTDHPERPTKPKLPETSAISTPSSPIEQTATTNAGATTTSAPTPTHTPSDSFLPSFFPTFGVSKRTQIWIYGSLVLIIIFCMALGTYFIIQRRKRRRNDPRAAYEFDVLPGDDDEVIGTGMTGHAGRQRSGRARRAGELYDAFAGESDEDLRGFSDDDSDDDDEGVRSGSGSGSLVEHDPERYRDAPTDRRGRGENLGA